MCPVFLSASSQVSAGSQQFIILGPYVGSKCINMAKDDSLGQFGVNFMVSHCDKPPDPVRSIATSNYEAAIGDR